MAYKKSIQSSDKNQYSAEIKKIVSSLAKPLQDNVSIREKSKKGTGVITVKYKSVQELESYLNNII